jgi:hypothetical protein
MNPIIDRWIQLKDRIQNTIVFIRKAWQWLQILWTAHLGIQGYENDPDQLVELWLVNHESAFQPGEIPLIVSALMFLEPEILRDWLDSYIPGEATYTHPEQLESFGEIYGSIIRQNKEISENPQSRIPSAGSAG